MLWDVILKLTVCQYGLVTRPQVLAAGGTDEWLRWAVRDGRLTRVRPGVYAIAGAVHEHQPLMSASLAAGETAAVSHLAAAALWGAEQVLSGRVEITTFDNRQHKIPGVVTHRSSLDATRAITRHLNLPVVVPPLTVVQLAETQSPYLVKRVANDLVKRHWTNFPAILEWVDMVGDRRRQPLRELCLRAIEVGGHYDSPAARMLCEKLTRAGAGPFELDYPVDTPGGRLLIDIAWPRSLLGLEYNGVRDHQHPLARVDDPRRHNRLVAMGWRLLDANRGMTHDEIVRWVLDALANSKAAGPS
jgi:hypothetical protein